MGQLGGSRSVRLQGPTKPIRTSLLYIAPHTDILAWGSALPKRVPRPGLHRLPHRLLVLRSADDSRLPLDPCGTSLPGQEGQAGSIRRARICHALLRRDGSLGSGTSAVRSSELFLTSLRSASCLNCQRGGMTRSTSGLVGVRRASSSSIPY